jgi:hypothetical protein
MWSQSIHSPNPTTPNGARQKSCFCCGFSCSTLQLSDNGIRLSFEIAELIASTNDPQMRKLEKIIFDITKINKSANA